MKTKTETNVLIAFTFLFWLLAAAGIVAAVWYKAWWLAAIGIMSYLVGFVMSMEIERRLLKFDFDFLFYNKSTKEWLVCLIPTLAVGRIDGSVEIGFAWLSWAFTITFLPNETKITWN